MAASFMAMAGVDLMLIKQVLGHKTIQMRLRYSRLVTCEMLLPLSTKC
jgi:hypothetical protein